MSKQTVNKRSIILRTIRASIAVGLWFLLIVSLPYQNTNHYSVLDFPIIIQVFCLFVIPFVFFLMFFLPNPFLKEKTNDLHNDKSE